MIAAKVVIGAGILLFGATLFGFIRSDAVLLVIGIAAVLAGIAFLGSSRGTLEQLAERIRTYEAHRAELIDGLDLRSAQDRL
jgi:hypothetical protein